MANYSCKKFTFTTYSFATIHLLQTDDNLAISSTTSWVRSAEKWEKKSMERRMSNNDRW